MLVFFIEHSPKYHFNLSINQQAAYVNTKHNKSRFQLNFIKFHNKRAVLSKKVA